MASETKQIEFQKHNLWSSLALQFQTFKLATSGHLSQIFSTEIQPSISLNLNIKQLLLSTFQKILLDFENHLKKKMTGILFQCSINLSQVFQKTKQLNQLEANKCQEKTIYQSKINFLIEKNNELEKLVRIYEKTLSKDKIQNLKREKPTQIMLKQSRICLEPIFRNQTKVLGLQKIYSIKIINIQQSNSISESKLAFSCMTSSRVSRSSKNDIPLRQLEQNWNKSVNLSSKNIKTANKRDQRTGKHEKMFIKSHINQKNTNRSSIEQNGSLTARRRQQPNKGWRVSEFWVQKKDGRNNQK